MIESSFSRYALKSLWRRGATSRGYAAFLCAFSGLVGTLSTWRLSSLLRSWQLGDQSSLNMRLAILVLGIAIAGGFFSLLVALKTALDGKSVFLLTLPIRPPTRFRCLYLSVVIGMANLWVLIFLVLGTSLTIAFGPLGALWLALAMVALALAVGFALVSLLAFLSSHKLLSFVVVAFGVVLIGALSLLIGDAVAARASGAMAGVGLTVGASVLLLILGPMAGLSGRAYEKALQRVEVQSAREPRRHGMGWFTVLSGWNSPAGALVQRDLARRSRHWFNWARLLAVGAGLAAFPWLRSYLAGFLLPDPLWVVGYVGLLSFFIIFDGASSPIGSEGHRLKLLLTAPLSFDGILWAKAVSFFVPLFLFGLSSAALIGWLAGLGAVDLLKVVFVLLLLFVGLSSIIVAGSGYDADPEYEVPFGVVGTLYEEAPITLPRMILVILGLIFLGCGLMVFWKLSFQTCAIVLTTGDLLILWLSRRLALSALSRVVRS